MSGHACSLSQPQLEQKARAPAGWEGFCFPAPIAFVPATDRISPGTERMMPVIYDTHLRRAGWLSLAIEGGPEANDPAVRDLANRRAQAALRLLDRLGTPPARVEVHIAYDRRVPQLADVGAELLSPPNPEVPVDFAAYVVTMIPPEQVALHRARQREDPSLVFC